MAEPVRVLIVGATGVFGSRLAERLAREAGVELLLAARNAQRLRALSERLDGRPAVVAMDRDRIAASDLGGVDLVIDAAGPFQASNTGLIAAAIAAGAHYADLADGREFVRGIGQFDAAARRAGVAVLSGASSVPALSHAVIDHLTRGWSGIDTIRVGIFPGNRAPRGRSVVEAILSYAGKPVRMFRSGRWQSLPGWGDTHRWAIPGLGSRWASLCDTPDQDLLVERYRPARSAEFHAGLELSVLHLGLTALSLPVRLGLVRSLVPAAGLLHRVAGWFVPLGSDAGAMDVRVDGRDGQGQPVSARWTLLAQGNRGPYVPTLAAAALVRHLRDGDMPEPGARACAGILTLADFAADFADLRIATAIS